MALPEFGRLNVRTLWETDSLPPGHALFGTTENVKFPIYRYTSRDWFNAALISGNWYLGTLYGYRDLAVAGSHRQDIGEGLRFDRDLISKRLGVTSLIGGYCRNLWTMCCTSQQADQFLCWEHNDCCFIIHDERFFIELAKGLRHRALNFALCEVGYADWSEFVDVAEREEFKPGPFQVDIATWKLPHDRWQNEIRFMVEPWCLVPSPGIESFHWTDLSSNLDQAACLSNLKPIYSYAPEARNFVSFVN